jgi:hypothetical protein
MRVVSRKLRVNLLIHTHTVGLRTDALVFRRALRACDVDFTITSFSPQFHSRALRAVRKAASRFDSRPAYDINIFVEDIVDSWCPLARVNVLFPHQEWVTSRLRTKIKAMDYVFCKTRYAARIFAENNCKVIFTGFTSIDRYDDSVRKDFNGFLHVAGSSQAKGTSAVNEVWLRHPEWPKLTMLAYKPDIKLTPAANITTNREFLNEVALRRMQNANGIHLCPSEAEGFGHYLVEAMSMGAFVVTTDAPPMNELVQPERGALAGYRFTEPGGMGTNFYVDPAELERTIDAILRMDDDSRRAVGRKARAWFLENDRVFLGRFRQALFDVGSA